MATALETHYTVNAMDVEPFEKVGLKGFDFVIYDPSGSERFSARMLEGSVLLRVLWTDSISWTGHRLRETQRLAGGHGSIGRIQGHASDQFKKAIKDRSVTERHLKENLDRALGGAWTIEIEETVEVRINVTAIRVGD